MKIKKNYLYFIFVAIIFLLVFFFIFGYSYFKKIYQITKSPEQTEAITQIQNNNYIYDQARTTGDVNLCQDSSSDEAKALCIRQIAVDSQSTSSCLAIMDEGIKNNCLISASFERAVSAGSLLDCQNLGEQAFIMSCVDKVVKQSNNFDCLVLDNLDAKYRCLSNLYYKQAKEKNDSNICNLIPELSNRANCLSDIEKVDLHSDADNDGLSFLDEILNSTNPNDPDTDNDGHLDGEEISAGYNPKGEGVLTIKYGIYCPDIKDGDIKLLCANEVKDYFLDYTKCDEIVNQRLALYCINEGGTR